MMMRNLMRVSLMLGLLFVIGINYASAQDEITEQDLKDYAVIELAKESILRSISPWVQSTLDMYNDKQSAPENKITSDRWKQLEATKGDDAKLAAIEANAGEISITKQIQTRIDKKIKAAGNVVTLLASNGLGKSKYDAVKSAVESDAATKAKLDAIINGF